MGPDQQMLFSGMNSNVARAFGSIGVFGISLFLMAFACTWAWDAFVNGKVYYCTDGGTLDFVIGVEDWVHNPESVVHVAPRSMGEPDEIKNGWGITGLWWLWLAFVAVSIAISSFFAGVLWRVKLANQPDAPNAVFARRLTLGHQQPGSSAPDRWGKD